MKRQFDIKYIFQKMIMILLALGILTVGMTLSPNVHAADTGTSSNVSEPNPSNPDSSESGSTDPDTDNPSEPEPDEKLPQVILASSLTAHYDDAPFTLEASLTTGDGALSFTSSKPEVADVDESGLVTIHGIGKTSIKITAAETEQYLSATKTITLTVYATLIAPDNLSVTESARGNTLTWTPQTTCDGYYIYRKTAGESSWTQIGTVIGKTVRSWTDTTAPNGVLCQYRMTSYDKTASESDFSGPVTYVHLTRPSVTKVTSILRRDSSPVLRLSQFPERIRFPKRSALSVRNIRTMHASARTRRSMGEHTILPGRCIAPAVPQNPCPSLFRRRVPKLSNCVHRPNRPCISTIRYREAAPTAHTAILFCITAG
jgi:hypothetical protein